MHEWSAQYGIESNQYFEPEAAVNVKRADDPLAKTPSNDLRPDQEDAYSYEDADHTSPSGMPRPVALNESDALPFESPLLHERAWVNPKVTWEMSQVSHPKGFEWGEAGELGGGSGVDGDWHFSHDNDIGADQWIYVIGEKAASPWVSHNVGVHCAVKSGSPSLVCLQRFWFRCTKLILDSLGNSRRPINLHPLQYPTRACRTGQKWSTPRHCGHFQDLWYNFGCLQAV